MKIGKMNAGVLLAMGILGLATGAAWASVASSQSVTVVESDNAGFYLSGTGPGWTLVTAPQHGTLKLWSCSDWSYHAWTPGMTITSAFKRDRGPQSVGYVLYCPTPGYVGADSFTWHSGDASGPAKDAVCSITVTANHPPVANNQTVTCAQGVADKYVGLNYTHADNGGFKDRYYDHIGQAMSFTLVSAPTHGTLKYYNGGKHGSPQGTYMPVPIGKPIPYYGWNYTPNEGYSGADSFTWKCNDTFVDSGTATAAITVTPKGASVLATKSAPVSKDGAYVGPGDIVPDAMAWYGVRGYSRAVAATGTQKAVRINRFSDGASMDVFIKPNGDLDAAAAAAFCADTLACVELWYDQSGHGNDLMGGCMPDGSPLLTTISCSKTTKGGASHAFTLDSLPCIEIQGDDRQFTNTKFVGAAPAGTFSTVASRRNGGFGGQIMLMNALNGRSLITWLLFDVPAFNQAALDVSTGNSGTRMMTGVDETDRDAFHAFQGVINGASSVLNVDGTPTFGNLEPANLSGSFWSGGNYGGGGFMGKMTEEGVWPTVFSPEEQAAMYQNQRNYWHLPAMAGVRRGVAEVGNARKAPQIDGTLVRFSSGWMRPLSLLLGKVESTDIGPLQTTAHVLMDKQNLYVAWCCQEGNTDALVANATERDNAALRSDDSVEMFLSPDEKTYYHFIVNSKGVFSDGKGALNQKEDLTWNSSATIKTSVDKGRNWTVTMSLPLSELAPPGGKNQKWLLNFNRTKPVKDKAGNTTFIQSSWSSAGHGNYNDASGWGKLTGVNIP